MKKYITSLFVLVMISFMAMTSIIIPTEAQTKEKIPVTVSAKKIKGSKKKVSVYVIKGIKDEDQSDDGHYKYKYSVSYTSDGKIKKITGKGSSDDTSYKYRHYEKYEYNSQDKIIKCSIKYTDDPKYYYWYQYDDKGRVIQRNNNGKWDKDDIEYYEYNNSGRCSHLRKFDTSTQRKFDTFYKYNKSGYLKSIDSKKLRYDKHHNLKSYEGSNIKNSYKKGRLIKTFQKYEYGWWDMHKFEYKKISVPQNKKSLIKAQQRWLKFSRFVDEYPPLEVCYK